MEPTEAPAGTEERIKIGRTRVATGMPVFNPDDLTGQIDVQSLRRFRRARSGIRQYSLAELRDVLRNSD